MTLSSKCKIDGEDFVNFCGLLRKHELYMNPQENVLDITRTHIELTKIFYVFRKRLVGKQLTHFVTLKQGSSNSMLVVSSEFLPTA